MFKSKHVLKLTNCFCSIAKKKIRKKEIRTPAESLKREKKLIFYNILDD